MPNRPWLLLLATLAASYAPIVGGMFMRSGSERVYLYHPLTHSVFLCAVVLQCFGCILFVRISKKVYTVLTLVLLVLLPIPLVVIMAPALVGLCQRN
jgi:hypothetical protein